jgi:hypothetical protein
MMDEDEEEGAADHDDPMDHYPGPHVNGTST